MVALSRFVALPISLTPKASLSQCLFNVRSAHASYIMYHASARSRSELSSALLEPASSMLST